MSAVEPQVMTQVTERPPALPRPGENRKADGVAIIRPDHARRIDLPGAGPCLRPVDVDRARTGFRKLVALRVYSFVRGVVIDGEAEGDEVFIVLMRGAADIAISDGDRQVGLFSLRRDDGPWAVYMPPGAAYRLTAIADCDIAYARAEPSGTMIPEARGFAPVANRLDISGHATAMDLEFAPILTGEAVGSAKDGRLPERFLHLRGDAGMKAVVAGEPLDDWDSVALGDGDSTTITVATGTADVLTIRAAKSRNTASPGAIRELS